VEREYGNGRGRTDLTVFWPRGGSWEPDKPVQRVVIELKILRGTMERTVTEGLEQTAGYMDRCRADEGHLVIFDRRPKVAWSKKIFRRTKKAGGRTIVVWGA